MLRYRGVSIWTVRVKAKKNVVLVGPMGTGKTTIGKLLAKELQFEFVDSDREIEARCGADIPWIFDVEGEVGFRGREKSVIADLSQRDAVVIATGGGAVVDPDNQIALKENGFIVYLHTSVEQQYQRTRKDRKRPLLRSEDPLSVLKKLMSVREPIYRSIADLIISTDSKRPKGVVRDIVKTLRASREETVER
ncbi:Shikimate kinase [Hahella chejuensis KCTC 2396]|uniref:Shikimate kinase n=1 Tax=Hahella chejuensis (strain KCTC 2396) TaxID=349521 RepID=AROK_HAHCH|nr:shikimate kinase AroK [Hahella chejuensis]Q2S9Q5.1 RecName: Full=Shikimate kinase; Short=SK [Hahella chejuensis KCTC 2396]ABC32619.1 Shikimate kinase [Hahella chejuensis KCTC 2396]